MTAHQRRLINMALRDAFNAWVELRLDHVELAQMLNAAAARTTRVINERGDAA